VATRRAVQAGGERLFQQGESLRGRGRRAEPLAKLGGRPPPEGFEIDVRVGQFAGGDAEERGRPARPEVDAHERRVLRVVAHEEPAVGPGDDRPGVPPAAVGARGIMDPDLVLAEVDHQLDRPVREESRSRVRGRVRAQPELLDEVAERRGGGMGTGEHGSQSVCFPDCLAHSVPLQGAAAQATTLN
jgi:hypothetical protein